LPENSVYLYTGTTEYSLRNYKFRPEMATAADGHLSSAFVTLILNTEDWGFTREQCLFFRQILLLL
jgi:hypothetical protein